MKTIYLVKKIWIDAMENKNSYGWKAIGYVKSKKEADRIAALKPIKKTDYPWPLEYAFEFKGDFVPTYTVEKLKPISEL